MKKFALLLALSLLMGLTACNSAPAAGTTPPAPPASTPETAAPTESPAGETVELYVFAAASMTETLKEIADQYREIAPNVTLVYTFDSSGTLKTQIEQGADCDLFISAAQKQMDQLDAANTTVNTDGLDFVASDTRIDLLQNKVVLVVPDGNPADIQSFADVGSDKLTLIALGNSDVPVGQYSEEIFTSMGLWDDLNAAGKITFGTNVKEVTSQVGEGAVDCGVVYATDAYSAQLTPVDEAPEGSCKPVVYPAAVMKNSAHPAEAQAFLDYLTSDAAAAVFESVGFSVVA